MSFNKTPTEFIPGWSEDGTDITFPIASLPGLTAEDADAVTGDSRKILLAILNRALAWYEGLDTADKPTKLVATRVFARGDIRSSGAGEISNTFTTKLTMDAAPLGIADEPIPEV